MFFKRSQTLAQARPTVSRSPTLPSRDQQHQSIFLSRLPAELRNHIYALVFSNSEYSARNASASRLPPHPLSLLLTCRRIYNEASLLAFNTYTFPLPISLEPTYLSLKSTIAHLSTPQTHAIRSLSTSSSTDAASLLSNAMLLLPHLHHFAITSETRREHSCGHYSPPRPRSSRPGHRSTDWSEPTTELSLRAIDTYAPPWFVYAIESVAAGMAFKWQTGSRWTAHWPQLDSELCYSRIQCDAGGLREELYMDADAVGAVLGVKMCRCKGVSWTRAVLVQEGGRCVDVEVVYRGGPELEVPERKYVPKVVLMPGTASVGEVVIASAGIGYEADEEYWEAMRRKNGHWGALCRGFWKSASAAAWPPVANDCADQKSDLTNT